MEHYIFRGFCRLFQIASFLFKNSLHTLIIDNSENFFDANRELKETRCRRKRERHLKMSLRVSAIIFQFFKVIMFQKCVLIILDVNWNQR